MAGKGSDNTGFSSEHAEELLATSFLGAYNVVTMVEICLCELIAFFRATSKIQGVEAKEGEGCAQGSNFALVALGERERELTVCEAKERDRERDHRV